MLLIRPGPTITNVIIISHPLKYLMNEKVKQIIADMLKIFIIKYIAN